VFSRWHHPGFDQFIQKVRLNDSDIGSLPIHHQLVDDGRKAEYELNLMTSIAPERFCYPNQRGFDRTIA